MKTISKILLLYAHILASALWARFVVAAAKPGLPRLVLSVPIVAANALVPLIFDPDIEFILYSCNLLLLVWLANFKIVSLALDRGSLSYENLTALQFIILYALPITAQNFGSSKMPRVKSNSRFNQSAGSNTQLAFKWAMKLVFLLGIVYFLSQKVEWMPVLLTELAEAFMLYWFLGVLMDGPAALIGWLTRMPISPHFDAPYLSSSMSDFWSKRWNLTVGNTLRALCYDPVHEGRLVSSDDSYKPSRLRSAVAVCWTFIASGLMHELLIWYIDHRAATGEWLLYFAVQGPLLLAETYVRKLSKQQQYKVPRPVSIAVTLTIQLLLGHCLFFPPAVRNGLDVRFFNDVGQNLSHLCSLSKSS